MMTPERKAEIKEAQKHGNNAYVDELLNEVERLQATPHQGIAEAIEALEFSRTTHEEICYHFNALEEQGEKCDKSLWYRSNEALKVTNLALRAMTASLRQTAQPEADLPQRPTGIGIHCQPIEGLLYDLDLLPEQISEGKGREWTLMQVVKGMHHDIEALEDYATALEHRLATQSKAMELVVEALVEANRGFEAACYGFQEHENKQGLQLAGHIAASWHRASEALKIVNKALTALKQSPPKDEGWRPTVVCLCGSTRFMDAFQRANLEETIAGRIVLSVGCNTKSDSDLIALGKLTEEAKAGLDELHKRKIDIADEVLILNVGGYVGSSTKSEIEYAKAHGKRLRWLEPSPPSANEGRTKGGLK